MPKGMLLPTGKAALQTGISKRTLTRWIELGWVEEGEHFFRGPHPRSPHRWDVTALEQRISKLRNELQAQGSVA